MRKTIKLAVITALALGATSAFATNGDQMMALGAKSTAMGGVGIATAFGAESSLANAALIRGNEVSFGGTIFEPDVSFRGRTNNPNDPATFQDSDADFSVIPSIGFVHDVNENFTWGLGMFGTAGMGTDYRDDKPMYNNGTQTPDMDKATSTNQNAYMGTMNGTSQMSTALQIMKFTLPMAYRASKSFSIGFAPVVQYGSLGMSYNNGAYTSSYGQNGLQYNNVRTGAGSSDDLGIGYEVGLAYTTSGLTLGAVYKSEIKMEYKNQIGEAMTNFGLGHLASDVLEQPAEMGVGISYTKAGNTLAVDYKSIAWSSAEGYETFGWEDQDVIAVGYEYKNKKFAFRLGYNHANNPIVEQNGAAGLGATGPTNYEGAVINYFNLAGFPAIIESSYTVGGSIYLSKVVSMDLAYVYSPEVSQTFDTSAMTQGQMMASGMDPADPTQAAMIDGARSDASVNHSQSAITIAFNVAF